jgi:hypothetical protein
MTINDALRTLEDRAGMLKFLANAATAGESPAAPDPCVFNGLYHFCAEVQECMRQPRRFLLG